MQEIHSFDSFSISRSTGGDYYAETDDGRNVLLLSPSGSCEHAAAEKWICSGNRTAADFLEAYPEIASSAGERPSCPAR